jgi:hypothetical protein
LKFQNKKFPIAKDKNHSKLTCLGIVNNICFRKIYTKQNKILFRYKKTGLVFFTTVCIIGFDITEITVGNQIFATALDALKTQLQGVSLILTLLRCKIFGQKFH